MTDDHHVEVHWHDHAVAREEREALNAHKGCVVWFTGLSACGKSTVANLVDHKLHSTGVRSFVLDGDNIRHGLNKNLGFSAEDREENIRRLGEVGKLFVDAGLITITEAVLECAHVAQIDEAVTIAIARNGRIVRHIDSARVVVEYEVQHNPIDVDLFEENSDARDALPIDDVSDGGHLGELARYVCVDAACGHAALAVTEKSYVPTIKRGIIEVGECSIAFRYGRA